MIFEMRTYTLQPGSLLLLAGGLHGMGGLARRRKPA